MLAVQLNVLIIMFGALSLCGMREIGKLQIEHAPSALYLKSAERTAAAMARTAHQKDEASVAHHTIYKDGRKQLKNAFLQWPVSLIEASNERE